jgi:hypothetical protein
MHLPHDTRLRGYEEEKRISCGSAADRPRTGSDQSVAERGRFCVMIFAGSGNFNESMQRLSSRLKKTPLPIESVDTKHGLVEVVVNGSLGDLNDVFFRIGREFQEIIHQ